MTYQNKFSYDYNQNSIIYNKNPLKRTEFNCYYVLVEADDLILFKFENKLQSLLYFNAKSDESQCESKQDTSIKIDKIVDKINKKLTDRSTPGLKEILEEFFEAEYSFIIEGYGFDFIKESKDLLIEKTDELTDGAIEHNYYNHKGEEDWHAENIEEGDVNWQTIDDDYEWLNTLTFDIRKYDEIMSRYFEILELFL